MELAKMGKGLLVVLMAAYLAGCSSQGGSRSSDGGSVKGKTGQSSGYGVATGVVDPAVQAVMDSGKIQGSYEQIAERLDQTAYAFGYDSDRLSADDYRALDVQAVYLMSEIGEDVTLIIRGHTDERGTRTYNLALGERRANAVKNYLLLRGITADRIEVISYGFEKPLDPSHNDSAWAKNRRAEISSTAD